MKGRPGSIVIGWRGWKLKQGSFGGYRAGEEGWGEVPSMDCQERSCAPFLSGCSPSGSAVLGLGSWAVVGFKSLLVGLWEQIKGA